MTGETLTWEAESVEGSDLLSMVREVPRRLGKGRIPIAATVLTLGIYAKGGERDWRGVAERVAAVHPARVLLINPADPDAPDPRLDAALAATARPRGQDQAPVLFSEFIQVRPKGRLASYWIDLVQPLVPSGLPAYLWWATRPPEANFRWDLLRGVFDHLLIDSGEAGVEAWSAALQSPRRLGMTIDDLNWVRTAPWRSALADAADVPELRSAVVAPDAIVMTGPNRTRLVPVLAWLVNRLDWKIDGSALTQGPDGLPVAVTWRDGPGTALRMRRDAVEVALEAQEDELRVVGRQKSLVRFDQRYPGERTDVVHHLLTFLSRGHDPLYDGAEPWLEPCSALLGANTR